MGINGETERVGIRRERETDTYRENSYKKMDRRGGGKTLSE